MSRLPMDRRRFLLTSLGGAVVAPRRAYGQQTERVHRIGLVGSGAPAHEIFGPHPRWPHWGVFIEELRALGWVEERNVRGCGGWRRAATG